MAEPELTSIEAIEAIYRGQLARFLHVANAIVGNGELAADAVQETFASAVRHRLSFRGEGPLEAWLWRTLINAARRQAQRAARTAAGASSLDGEASVANGSGGGENAALRALIASLPERQRLVLFLRYYADLDYGAIADALEISPGTVGSTLNSAHSALRLRMREAHQ